MQANCWQQNVRVHHLNGDPTDWDLNNIQFVHGVSGVPLNSAEVYAWGNYILLKTLSRPDATPPKFRIAS